MNQSKQLNIKGATILTFISTIMQLLLIMIGGVIYFASLMILLLIRLLLIILFLLLLLLFFLIIVTSIWIDVVAVLFLYELLLMITYHTITNF